MKRQPLTWDLLPGCVELWNRCLGKLFPMRPALLEQQVWAELNFDPEGSQAVFHGDRIIALLVLKRQQVDLGTARAEGRCWITALMVDPPYQGQGIGSALLTEARNRAARFSDLPVLVGADPGNLFPGVPLLCPDTLNWFARRGAVYAGLVCDLLNPALQRFEHHPKAQEAFAQEPDVNYRPAGPADREAVLTFLRDAFPGRWFWEVEQHFASGGRPEDVMIAEEAGQVVGFARIHCPESTRFGPATLWAPLFPGRHGGLGPIGVSPTVRGRGIGLALLSFSIAELRNRGIESGIIDWTTLVTFYGLMGFKPWRWYASTSLPPVKQ